MNMFSTNTISNENDFNKSFEGCKVAFLLSTGFDEATFLTAQKYIRRSKGLIKLVSPDSGLVTSWQGSSWGHNYAVDIPINQALSADFSMCVIPGGSRSADKLALSAHTKRFVNGFLASSKPLVSFNDANRLLSRLDLEERFLPETTHELSGEVSGTNDNHNDAVVRKGTLIQVSSTDESALSDELAKALEMAHNCLYDNQAA